MKILKVIFLLLILFLSQIELFAGIFHLTQDEKEFIKNAPDSIVIARRFNHFYQFLDEAKSFNTDKKIIRTNVFINKIIPKNDPIGTNEWASPKEFLMKGYGDCEDYVIAKYFTLLDLNIDEKKLYLSVVKVKGVKNYHMILLYQDDLNHLFVLDNLSWKIKLLEDRKDLQFLYAFNNNHSYMLKNNSLVTENNIKREEVEMFSKIYFQSFNQ
ncbi:MAG: transglutaminase-like cysteine peptidase [Arcobacter sp.]|nr:transglutaminase-like cysteine peptidase [Arcobacter sp.]